MREEYLRLILSALLFLASIKQKIQKIGFGDNTISVMILLGGIVLPLLQISSGHIWGDDGALYMHEAEALLNGTLPELYNQNQFMMDHGKQGPYLYPLGFPALLAPVILLFGRNLLLIKIYIILFWVIGVFYFLKILTQLNIKPEIKFYAILLLLTSTPFLILMDQIVSDIPFFCLYNLYLFLHLQSFQNKTSHVKLLFIGFLGFALTIIRTTGIFLPILSLLSFTFLFFVRKEKINQLAYYLISSFFFILLYLSYLKLFPFDFGGNEMKVLISDDHLSTFKKNLVYYFSQIELFVTGFYLKTIFVKIKLATIYHLIVVLILTSVGVLWFKKNLLALKNHDYPTFLKHIFILKCSIGFILIYLIWPYWQGFRFLFPVFPFLLIGSLVLIFKVKNTNVRSFLIILFVGASCLHSARVVYARHLEVKSGKMNESYTVSFNKLCDEVNFHTQPNDTIVFRKPRLLHLVTKRITVLPKHTENIRRFQYLILVKEGFKDDQHVPSDIKKEFIYENEEYIFYKLNKN